jgi:hypothetical protein
VSGMIKTLDEFEAEYRNGLGQSLPSSVFREANFDNICRFGDGVGDHNPLWRDEDYVLAADFLPSISR